MEHAESVDLSSRAREAERMLCACELCPRRCRANRARGERGYCGLDGCAHWFREMLHYGVEFELIPAHAIYLAGCNMRCAFCTATAWNADPTGAPVLTTEAMEQSIEERLMEGARCLLFVGGEPTVSLPAVLRLLSAAPRRCRVAWDSNMYMSAPARELLEGVVDVYLADFKFGNDECAARTADAPDYVETVTENLVFAERTASLIVRHLLMPGHFDCCFRSVLEWMRACLRAPRLALRGEYMPPVVPAPDPRLGRYVAQEEYGRAAAMAREAGVELVD